MNWARERESIRQLCSKARSEINEMPADGVYESVMALTEALEKLTDVSEDQENTMDAITRRLGAL